MSSNPVACRSRTEFHGGESGCCRNHAVDDDGNMVLCATQEHTDQARDVKAADLVQNVPRVVGVRAVYLDGAGDGVDLPLQTGAAQSRSPAGHLGDGTMEQHRKDGAAGGGVADAHFTGGNQVVTLLL